jgi:hypothetical protein
LADTAAPAESVLKSTVEIDDPANPAIKYEFTIPGVAENIRLGMAAKAVRRRYDPTGSGDLVGIDQETLMLAWSCAAFETLLVSAGVKWPYTAGQDGKPAVDHTKFPVDKLDTVLMVGIQLDAELARFRAERTANWNTPR